MHELHLDLRPVFDGTAGQADATVVNRIGRKKQIGDLGYAVRLLGHGSMGDASYGSHSGGLAGNAVANGLILAQIQQCRWFYFKSPRTAAGG